MKKILITSLIIILFISCSSEITPTPTPVIDPVVKEILYAKIVHNETLYSSKDFFDAGFNEYKEYNVSKLTGATEAWYGFWGPDEDNVKYYELRFYPDHSTAVSEGTPFAEDVIGENAKLNRKDQPLWRVVLPDRKRNTQEGGGPMSPRTRRLSKYADYIIFNNVIILCEGKDSEEAFKLGDNLISILKK